MPSVDMLVELRNRFLLDFQSEQLLVLDFLATFHDIVYASLMRRKSCSDDCQLILHFY